MPDVEITKGTTVATFKTCSLRLARSHSLKNLASSQTRSTYEGAVRTIITSAPILPARLNLWKSTRLPLSTAGAHPGRRGLCSGAVSVLSVLSLVQADQARWQPQCARRRRLRGAARIHRWWQTCFTASLAP